MLWILMIITVLLLSSLCIYLFIHFRENLKSSSIYGKQRIKYSIQPSMNIITRRLSLYRSNWSIRHHPHTHPRKANQLRSLSLANNFGITRCSHRRQSSIIDSKQLAQIQFSLPPTAETFRRRSVAICNNIIQSQQTTIDSILKTIQSSNQLLPSLVSFAIVYRKSSQINIHFHSFTSLSSTMEQFIIKIKLIPDGKIKELSINKVLPNENIFAETDKNDYVIQFLNISPVKLHEKALVMKFYGKDHTKKTIQLGHIGKIYCNEIEGFQNESPIDFIHEIENGRMSSMEILVSLAQHDHDLIVDITRIKGLKIDQKNLAATCFFRVILLDRHRPLLTHETKSYRLNSSTFSLHEPINFNIFAFQANNLDRLMIMISLFSNTNNTNEHQCLARVQLASPYICSGSGTIHWQQFKQRQSFSMWHTLIKQ